MNDKATFLNILQSIRASAWSQHDKGFRFERLMQAYLLTDPKYSVLLKKVWLWNEFPGRYDFGSIDTGIDLVALTHEDTYWAVQCKCYAENAFIDKPAVDSFLSTSSRYFISDNNERVYFSHRLWISTTNHWSSNAAEALKNQSPPASRINLTDLIEAPVDWSQLEKGVFGEIARFGTRELRHHQKEALENAHEHFNSHDRGKMIMACGTGKTFTALRIAEKETDGKGLILFMVPSIALLGQTLREWTTYASHPINAICICSDPKISSKKTLDEDTDTFSVIDLALPASTNVSEIIHQFKYLHRTNQHGLTVVFSTYQSIDVVSRTQQRLKEQFPEFESFDLIICDEAHRTTGVTLSGEDESAFTKIHDNSFIQGKKRLYMTATPRLFSDDAKSKAAQAEAILCSMDDQGLYGEEFYRIGFGEAVEKDLLTDYKVLILTLSDQDVPPAVQKMVANKETEINADDASKLIGCINALSKQILGDEGILKVSDPEPMRRAVAFCQNIKISKKITQSFNSIVYPYKGTLPAEKQDHMVNVAAKHIDGAMSAPERDELLSWLKADTPGSECRVLNNVRCLSEGVDVPSLDAVMFLSARNSQVDVVQSVGRVMRKSPGKKYGYIIIPVVAPANVAADKALDDNERYKVVWTVLNALRAHDDRFNATVNKIELNKKRPNQILVGRTAVTYDTGGEAVMVAEPDVTYHTSQELSRQLTLQFEELQHVVFARMVQKVGDRRYWEQWAKDVAVIADRQIERITYLIKNNEGQRHAFGNFLAGLQKNINPSITENQAVEMLAQHIITKPVFEALFEGYSFVKNNAVSSAMQGMLDALEETSIAEESDTLRKFYESVRKRAEGIDNAEGKQRIIIELYDKFFKAAFPKMVEQLGIVYTPVEVVDFIIHSVNDILKKEFGRSLTDENVHILDPFTGTGTFMTRLLQSGLIEEKDLERKYKHELHANEIVLLAYYIAAVNIENAYHDATPDPDDGIGTDKYTPFEGIVLTDTFQLGENDGSDKLFSEMFPRNSERVARQMKAPLMVIMGNPPYSVGQKSANDNAQNQSYRLLDARIAKTYAAASTAGLNKSLYDAYIKAYRWSTDRLDKTGGIICFVSNGAWLDGNSTDGFRKHLEKEFTSIYVFNLRGNQRTSGELSRREGGKIFGSGSRTPIAITLLVKNPEQHNQKAQIFYHDIGDYLSREEKLTNIKKMHSFGNNTIPVNILTPNEYGDWISLRNDLFSVLIPAEPEKKFELDAKAFFISYSNGIATGKDAWVYNSSSTKVINNLQRMLDFYNNQRLSFVSAKNYNPQLKVEEFVNYDSKCISWSDIFLRDIGKNIEYSLDINRLVIGLYRPFFKQIMSYDKIVIHRSYQLPRLFPNVNTNNRVIIVSGIGASKPFSSLISDCIPNYHTLDTDQCFSLYYYEERKQTQTSLFDSIDSDQSEYIRHDGVSDFILKRAHQQYGHNVTKEDIFYYVYGFLHSPEYRIKFTNDLKKMLPRLPLVEDVRDFWAFSKAGRKLADLHINYEKVPPYDGVTVTGAEKLSFLDEEEAGSQLYIVEKMRFPKKDQKDTIIYNSRITISNIPLRAYDYVVNGKSAIEWIMERYQVTVHKESGIRNDPNDWATEVGNPRYILDLLLSIINVSMQTVEIVEGLPEVRWE